MEENPIDRTGADLAGWPNPLARLRAALQKDEFALYCQPRGVPAGVRALRHDAAARPLGAASRREAARARGSRIPRFTVNVSGQTLLDAAFPPHVAAELRAAGIPASAVLFEIDESDVLDRLEAAARFATAVKAFGGGVLIDGFCRRAVSFAPLKALRVDYVKVDGSVIRRLLTSDAAQTKLKAVVLRAGFRRRPAAADRGVFG